MNQIMQDTLDGMFPNGYMIFYTQPDGTIRFNIFNPNNIQAFNTWAGLLLQSEDNGDSRAEWKKKEDDNWGPIPDSI